MTLELRQREGDGIARLAYKSASVRSLVEQIEGLRRLLRETYRSGVPSRLVEAYLSTHEVPRLPEEEIGDVVRDLEYYERELREYLESLTRFAGRLEELQQLEQRLRSRLPELEAWAARMGAVNPYHGAEGERLVGRVRRALESLDLESLERAIEDLRRLVKDQESYIRLARSMYLRRLDEIEARLETLKVYVNRAAALAGLEDAPRVEEAREFVREIALLIGEAREKAPHDDLDLEALCRRIDELREVVATIASKGMRQEEDAVLRECGRLSRAMGQRGLQLSAAVDMISKGSGLRVEEVLRTLYSLDRKGLVRLVVRFG